MIPFDKLRSLPGASQYLRQEVSWRDLEVLATDVSDHEAAKRLNQAREELFRSFGRKSKAA